MFAGDPFRNDVIKTICAQQAIRYWSAHMSSPSLMMTANPATRATIAGKDSFDNGANDLHTSDKRQVKHRRKRP